MISIDILGYIFFNPSKENQKNQENQEKSKERERKKEYKKTKNVFKKEKIYIHGVPKKFRFSVNQTEERKFFMEHPV